METLKANLTALIISAFAIVLMRSVAGADLTSFEQAMGFGVSIIIVACSTICANILILVTRK